jgi:hypothetical protein
MSSSFVKSEYPRLQYHWCPTAFSVNTGFWISSIVCNNRRDGIAINTRTISGAVVQMVSIILCLSRMNSVICLFWMIHIQWMPVACSPRVKHPGCEVNHSPPISVKMKNEWSCTSVHSIYLHGMHGTYYTHTHTHTNICVCVCVICQDEE